MTARKDNINTHSFKSLVDIEKYADQTVSSALYLILEGCNVRDVNADHAASHLGKSQGIVQQLRCIPYAKKLNFIPLPEEVLIKNQVSQEEVFRGTPSERLSECVYEVASRAHQHLIKSKSLMDKVPVNGRPALLPAIPILNYLENLQKVDYNVLNPSLQQRSWKILPSIYISNLRNIY